MKVVRQGWMGYLCLISLLGMGVQAHAGTIEIGGNFSFNRSRYSAQDFSWTRRWGASLGYHFNDKAEIEAAFQDVVNRSKISDYEDTTLHDQIYSASWVQSLFGGNFPIQPYVRIGLGQIHRRAFGLYANGEAPASRVDELTGILGAGIRIFIIRSFVIRADLSSYLRGGSIRNWRDDVASTIGVSFLF